MTFTFLGPDPVEDQLAQVLRRLAAGEAPQDIECAHVDVKEERGRRTRDGALRPGERENDVAARHLAGEMACLANTPGGGAIVLGVADDGEREGTALDPEWLRHRIWELTDRRLTVTVRPVDLDGTRVLALTTHDAIEPIRFEGKLRWRVDDHCVEVDPTSWHAGRLQRSGVDWSAQPSGHTLADVSPVAVELARRYLIAAGDDASADLAAATDEDLVRRLNLVGGDGRLTNAGSLLLVGTPEVGLDYIRRDVPGGDSTVRVRGRRALLQQVYDVDTASQASNRVVHLADGFASGQLRAIPARALREAIVNGVVHRDWLSPEPTTVEHIGDVVTVTSPGGFIGGVGPSNIITHPSVPRYRSLAEAMASLRLAEREGIGVDRMVRDMLAQGHQQPEISEVAGPYVRVGLLGGDPHPGTLRVVGRLEPRTAAADVDVLLLINHLTRRGWVDVDSATAVVQRPSGEAQAAIERLAAVRVARTIGVVVTVGDEVVTRPLAGLVVPVKGVPQGAPAAYRLADEARKTLGDRVAHLTSPQGRADLVLGWAQARGRVSSTEAADLTGLSVPSAGSLLGQLESDGLLAPGRETRMGRGFFYVPVR